MNPSPENAIRLEDLEIKKIISDDIQFPVTKCYVGDQIKKNQRSKGLWHVWKERCIVGYGGEI
jgi:hypothetical protein